MSNPISYANWKPLGKGYVKKVDQCYLCQLSICPWQLRPHLGEKNTNYKQHEYKWTVPNLHTTPTSKDGNTTPHLKKHCKIDCMYGCQSSFPVQWETLCKVVNAIYFPRFLSKHSKHFRGLRMTILFLQVYLSKDVGLCHSNPPFSAITMGVQLLVSKCTVGRNISKKFTITYWSCRFSHSEDWKL